jgi:2-desacetyl-2-hydroxyethyl bacteriochlorophyllide A dehydrogenase
MEFAGERVVIKGPSDVVLERYALSSSDLAESEFMVRNRFTAISSGTELSIYTGANPRAHEPGSWCHYPHVPGYAGLGEVVSVGSDVSEVKVGDLLFHHAHHSSFDRLWEEHSHYARLPDGMSSPEVCLVRFAAIVLSGSVRLSEIKLGDRVALVGLGLVGQMAAQLFSLAGCDVVAFDPVQRRRKIAQEVGACLEVFDPNQNKVQDACTELFDNWRGADILVDATGSPSLVASNIELVRPMGQVVLLGTPFASQGGDIAQLLRTIHLNRLVVRGALERDNLIVSSNEGYGAYSYLSDVRYLLGLLNRGKLKCKEMLSHVVSPEDMKRAYEGLLNKKEEYISVALDWRKET